MTFHTWSMHQGVGPWSTTQRYLRWTPELPPPVHMQSMTTNTRHTFSQESSHETRPHVLSSCPNLLQVIISKNVLPQKCPSRLQYNHSMWSHPFCDEWMRVMDSGEVGTSTGMLSAGWLGGLLLHSHLYHREGLILEFWRLKREVPPKWPIFLSPALPHTLRLAHTPLISPLSNPWSAAIRGWTSLCPRQNYICMKSKTAICSYWDLQRLVQCQISNEMKVHWKSHVVLCKWDELLANN